MKRFKATAVNYRPIQRAAQRTLRYLPSDVGQKP